MAVMKNFVPLLKEKGIKKETLDKLLIYNPARILDKKS
jgi:predicted metal-dependent phosphotriesterase family hydrolase